MATRCSCPVVMLPRARTKKAMPRASMQHNSHAEPSRASTPSYKFLTASKVWFLITTQEIIFLRIRRRLLPWLVVPRFIYQVFEDQAMGIVCYMDGKGEVVCEGYDEGPRFSRWSSKDTYHQRYYNTRQNLISSNFAEQIKFHFVFGLGTETIIRFPTSHKWSFELPEMMTTFTKSFTNKTNIWIGKWVCLHGKVPDRYRGIPIAVSLCCKHGWFACFMMKGWFLIAKFFVYISVIISTWY